ncbi:MAG: translation initiation factor IF-3 [Defluviitaleaceae bacterium]|nr:translation initiation factor IF-3 [Defluviitaleaceae bacterium]
MINEQIRDREVRLIGAGGEQLGIVSLKEAQDLADEKQMDLVKIAPQSNPPVCKIMDYSKHKFEQAKKDREARRRQKTVDTKELRLSPNIDTHDVDVKVRQAMDFLKAGHKVKVRITFYGREMGRTGSGVKILNEFAAKVADFGTIDRPAKMEGRSMVMFLAAKPEAKPQKENKETKTANQESK